MRLLKVKSVKEGVLLFLHEMEKLGLKRVMEVPLEQSFGLILGEEILAKEDLPAFSRSTVDGFAVANQSTTGATESIPTILKIVEEIAMGEIPKKEILPGEASKVLTGGMLPSGANAVVMIEDTEYLGEDLLAIYKPLYPLENVNAVGDDCKKGEKFFSLGRKITPKVMASCASLGYGKIKVYQPLRVAIVSTGDEILPPDVEIPLGKTRDINSFSLEALCRELAMDVVAKYHVSDVREELEAVLRQEGLDLLLVSGSSSQGEKDYLAELVQGMTPGLLLHGLAIKPGKPTILGSDGQKMILGLPGHPVSAMIVFKEFLEAAWRCLFSVDEAMKVEAEVLQNIPSTAGRRKVQLVELQQKQGEFVAVPVYGASGNVSTFAKADGYFVLEEEEEGVKAGEKVDVILLK